MASKRLIAERIDVDAAQLVDEGFALKTLVASAQA
jgi:hypothetical protein